jgi:hypothetical protein
MPTQGRSSLGLNQHQKNLSRGLKLQSRNNISRKKTNLTF